MRKLLATFSAVATLGLTAIRAAETLTAVATPVPHVEIPNVVKPLLAEEGVELKVKEFADYMQPDVQVSEERSDADFFQYQPYLGEFDKAKGTDLVAVTDVHVKPLGAYLSKYKKLDELLSGATVVIPNDATNGSRALLLLDKAGVIELKDSKNITATPEDIVDNLKSIEIRELEVAALSCVLTQVDMVLININYTLEAKLNPTRDVLVIEDSGSPYVNILAVRPDNRDSDAMQRLVKALHNAEVKQFIQEKYKGVVVLAF